MLRLGNKGRDVKGHFGAMEAGSLAGGQQGGGVDVGRECGCSSGVGDGDEGGGARGKMLGSKEDILCFLMQEVLGAGETEAASPPWPSGGDFIPISQKTPKHRGVW